MRKLAAICGLLALFVVPAMAQDQSSSDQSQPSSEQTKPAKAKRTYTTPKFELSGGYAYRTYYSTDGATLGMNGWYGSFDDNLKRWIGLTAEAVGVGKNEGSLYGDTHIYTFLVGPQIYPLTHRKLTPFGQVLIGVGYYRNVVPPFGDYPGKTTTSTVRAWQGGGGLDLKVSEHWSVRLVQVDFGSANFFPNTSSYVNRSMHRVSVGVVYHFGRR